MLVGEAVCFSGTETPSPTASPSATYVHVPEANQYASASSREMFGSNAYVSPAATTSWKMFQIASRSASVAGRIFIAANRNCRATALVAAIPATIEVQITQQARRAFGLRPMVHPLLAPIARDLVSPVSQHRWTVSTVRPRYGKREEHNRRPTGFHSRPKRSGLSFDHRVLKVTGTVACHPWLGADFHCRSVFIAAWSKYG